MKNWIIRKLGGFTRDELRVTQSCLSSMGSSATQHAQHFVGDRKLWAFYLGKEEAFATAARTVNDLLR